MGKLKLRMPKAPAQLKMLDVDWKNLRCLADGFAVDDHGNLRKPGGKITAKNQIAARSLNSLQLNGYVLDGRITEAGKAALQGHLDNAEDARVAALIGKGATHVFHFEDDDTDLLWCAVSATGEIVDCGRHKHIWVGKYISNDFEQVEVGEFLMYFIDGDYYFQHPVERIEDLKATNQER